MLDFMEDIDHEGGAIHRKVETHEIKGINRLLSTAEVHRQNHCLLMFPAQKCKQKCVLLFLCKTNKYTCSDHWKNLVTEMVQLLPAVLRNLAAANRLSAYHKFNKLFAEEKCQIDNIAFLLFNDVVNWYPTSNY
jgi:hypothetical protein